jgi:hypothetical protein
LNVKSGDCVEYLCESKHFFLDSLWSQCNYWFKYYVSYEFENTKDKHEMNFSS